MTPADRETVTQVFVNLGKAIAAYERQILPGPSRFDTYVQAALDKDVIEMRASLTADEVAGMRLFISENCLACHNGPLFSNSHFFNIGVPNAEDLPLDMGRFQGLQTVLADEFNCLGTYSDAALDECTTLTALNTGGIELRAAFKVPTLRNVAETAPYMSSGQYATLGEVLEHYDRAEPGPFNHTEVKPLNVSNKQLEQLEAFLGSLSGPLAVDPELLVAPTE
jgi:cytochrome c peroxidase